MNTRKNHQAVNPHTPAPPSAPAETIIFLTLPPNQIIPIPDSIWIGIIQLFLLPSFGVQTASTMGLHNSFKEYGYDAKLKIPIWPYDICSFKRKGTDPVAKPIGMPCRKYKSTSNVKFFRSCKGNWKKP
jgi:hypothetical protein